MRTKTLFVNWLFAPLRYLPVLLVPTVLVCLVPAKGRAQVYRVLHNFSFTNGEGYCASSDMVISGTTLYGDLWGGAKLFKINTDGNGFMILTNVGGVMFGSPTLVGSTLYGVAENPKIAENIVKFFRVSIDGSDYTEFYTNHYPRSTGYSTSAGTLTLSDTTLYGTTGGGGSNDLGTVFRIDTDGSGYAVLKYFSTNDGYHPFPQQLVLSGTTLYGTTSGGGIYNHGTVFKLDTDGTGYAVLKHFTGSDGADPRASLLLSDNILYGTTSGGGKNVQGVIFKLKADGSSYTILKQFAGLDGNSPQAKLLLSQSTLYGTTESGGRGSSGTVFKINTDGSGYTLLKEFYRGTNGGTVCAGLILSEKTLFGTTLYGGSFGGGLIFSLSIAPPTITSPPQSQTVEEGCSAEFSVVISNSFATTCTWLFDETNLASCSTNNWLKLTNCNFSQSGTYTVVVTNVFGAVTSSPVMLNVIPVVERRPIPGINVMGEAGTTLNVEYAESLGSTPNWLPLAAVDLTNTSEVYFDLTEPLPPQRFYRAWRSGTPSATPSLDLPVLVPAITLKGNIGDSLRLDYINAIGPTDAWVTLDTVTLTNTSQLYFDTSSIGQPRRLYRIVPPP